MRDVSTELVQLLGYLVPGFIAAWVFHGLTSHPRSSQFERVVQALILTTTIQAFVVGIRESLLALGERWETIFGAWTSESGLVWSVVLAFILGLFLSYVANTDKLHRLLRSLSITKETSYPSEWFSIFSRKHGWVVLHLTGQRRLYGWPEEWPSDGTSGHFSIAAAEWLDDHERTPLSGVDNIVVNAADVQMVEFLEQED